jgi:large subunit ribosomal protein L9
MGDVVSVKNGYARNYLLPQGKAQRATAENLASFEARRTELEARNLERRGEAEAVAKTMVEATFVVIRQAGESGQLYGSVQARDVTEGLDGGGFKGDRGQIVLTRPIKTLGLHPVQVNLHPEVSVEVVANVARSEAEAERQAAGEDINAEEEDNDLAIAVFDDDASEDDDAADDDAVDTDGEAVEADAAESEDD